MVVPLATVLPVVIDPGVYREQGHPLTQRDMFFEHHVFDALRLLKVNFHAAAGHAVVGSPVGLCRPRRLFWVAA